jgi:membrane-associated protease RseP (regulator of RpoE activity)
MKRIITTALVLLAATAVLADQPVRHTNTVIVRDGKVISGGDDRQLIETFFASRTYLGVSLMNLSPELREHFGATKDAGVIVESVQDDSPADKAGVRVGDIILSVDGTDVKSSIDLRRALADKKEGDTARIEVLRGRARQTLVATVKERDMPRAFQLGDLPTIVGTPEFRARVERLGGDCGDLQNRIKELETRLKDLEKKLQK